MNQNCFLGICVKCYAAKCIVAGIILIAARLYTEWDIWVVVGTLLVLMGILRLAKPSCPHCKLEKGKK